MWQNRDSLSSNHQGRMLAPDNHISDRMSGMTNMSVRTSSGSMFCIRTAILVHSFNPQSIQVMLSVDHIRHSVMEPLWIKHRCISAILAWLIYICGLCSNWDLYSKKGLNHYALLPLWKPPLGSVLQTDSDSPATEKDGGMERKRVEVEREREW